MLKWRMLLVLALVVIVAAGCLPSKPTPSPLPTPTIVSPVPTPGQRLMATSVPLAQRSKLSVHVGNRPEGLSDFLEIAHPTILYALNNSPYAEIAEHSPHTILIRRIQNTIWDRLPDAMYAGLFTDHWEEDARASARHEALEKKITIPNLGQIDLPVIGQITVPFYIQLNYMQYVNLTHQDYVAPMNEPVLGSGTGDYMYKARWLNAWFEEWLVIAHANGVKGSIYSFATGEPPLEAVPYLAGSARLAVQLGGIIDLHAYGVEGPIMDSPSSGAFWFVKFHDALPQNARPPFVVSEFSAGNGYDTGLHGQAWIDDALAYGLALRRYPYVLGAAAFQLDLGAESNIPPHVLTPYATQASQIDWSNTYNIYLPLVTR